MKIHCPSCSKEVPAANVDLSGRVAKCGACNNVFNCAGQMPASDGAPQAKSPAPMPKNFTVRHTGDGLEIVRTWFSAGTVFLTFFCLIWNGFMIGWFYTALTQKVYSMAFFGSLHAAAGIGLLYATLAGFLNKTYIRIAYNALKVTHAPIPWPGRRDIARQDIKQLYVKQITHSGKHGHTHSYTVEVITTHGKTIKLVSGFPNTEEARFIEQEVEKYIGITDERVSGEMS